ncbi:MAG TPA: HEAT repeat domain-containing protein [Anaerolineales bacterium]|nr:HEAT repeat domain-containing protein [Anaerolineales bacterium]
MQISSESEKELTGQLVRALGHPNSNVRAAAALALGRLKAVTAAEALLAVLADRVHLVRQNAAAALGLLGAPIVGLLLAHVQETAGTDQELQLSEALSHLRDPEAVDVLAAALNYLEPPARYGVAEALGAIRREGAVPALIQTLGSPDPISRQKAAQSLLDIGSLEAVRALTALLADPDPRLRELAVRGLAKIGDEPSVLSLLTTLEDPEERVRLATETALGDVRTPGMEQVLVTALNVSSAFAQRAIANTLGNYPDPRVIERLSGLMTEEGDLRTRLTAAQSLARLGEARGAAMILRTLNAPNEEIRRMAAIALGRAGDPRAAGPLIESLKPGALDPATPEGRLQRRMMFEAIAAVGPGIWQPLIELLALADPGIRGFAADALVNLGPAAAAPLAEVLGSHPKPEVRAEAARLLGRLGEGEVVEALTLALRETLSGPYPLIFLLRLLYDPTAPVRAASAAAIGQIGGMDGAARLLSSARFDPSPVVNAAAEAALARLGAPAITVRMAQPDVSGFINRALAAALALLLVGFLSGAVNRMWGLPDAVLLAGLAGAAVLGLADGLEGRARPIRFAVLGCLIAVPAAWLFDTAGQPAWLSSLLAGGLPAAGALAGWSRAALMQRLAGLFGGVVLGFIGAGAAGLLLGTIIE